MDFASTSGLGKKKYNVTTVVAAYSGQNWPMEKK